MKFSSQEEGINDKIVYDEIMVVNSLKVGRKMVDSLSRPTLETLRKNQDTFKKFKYFIEQGEVYAVFEKGTNKLLYKNEELGIELDGLASSLEALEQTS